MCFSGQIDIEVLGHLQDSWRFYGLIQMVKSGQPKKLLPDVGHEAQCERNHNSVKSPVVWRQKKVCEYVVLLSQAHDQYG